MNRTVAALDQEWGEILKSPASGAAVDRWRHSEPVFADLHDLHAVLEARRASDDAAQAVLGALARLATADALAARTLLQALIPGLLVMASTSCSDDPEAMDLLVSLAWERIRTYPVTRTGSVAANVLLDARKRYRANRQLEEPDAPLYQAPAGNTSPSAEDVALTAMAVEDLVRPHRAAVGHLALSIIVDSRVNEVPLHVVAAQHSTTTQHANCIRWRAERRLRETLDVAS